jgi:hypothetical protein
MRDRLMAVLAARGTDEAVAAVDELAVKYPSHGMARRKAEAREARLPRWTAPEPRHVILLAQSNDARIVLSDTHLQQAVMGALRRIDRIVYKAVGVAVRRDLPRGQLAKLR